MIIKKEDKVIVELINEDVTHITLYEGGVLCTHLLRELYVTQKAKTGTSAKVFIVDINHLSNKSENFYSICRKVEKYDPTIMIAVVCKEHCVLPLREAILFFQKLTIIKTFSTFSEALLRMGTKLARTVAARLLPQSYFTNHFQL